MRSFIILSLSLFFLATACLTQMTPTIVWQECLGGSYDDEAYSIQQTSDGGFIVAGKSSSNDGDVSGWHEGYDGVSPTSDYWIVKLSPEDDVAEDSGISTGRDAITITAFPNPFNSSCKIFAPAEAKIEIYDLRGNVISEQSRPVGIATGQDATGQGETAPCSAQRTFIWHPDENISTGVYLIKATTTDGLSTIKRIVYLK